jgi:hypothetical protein
VPLISARVQATGEITVKAVLPLLVRTARGRFKPLDFLVDTGSSVTTIAVTKAERAGIVVPNKSLELDVQTGAGPLIQRRHPGHITVQVPGLEGWQFVWPCHFVEYEARPPIAALGLAGVLNDFRLTFDGSYALDAPYGWLILEHRSP